MRIGHTEFFMRHFNPRSGVSFTTLDKERVVKLIVNAWPNRKPGLGEGDRLDRKVVVPIHEELQHFFCQPKIAIKSGLPVKARVISRQVGEDPYVETYVSFDDAIAFGYEPIPAKTVNIVCYSDGALRENDGNNDSGAEWGTVALLCADRDIELMLPLTMARNHLEKTGGTKPAVAYSGDDWANAIWEHSINRGIKVCD